MRQNGPVEAMDDILSAAVKAVLQLNQVSAYEALVPRQPGAPQAWEALARLSVDGLVQRPVRDREAASAMLAGLGLWHDFLDESHEISQGIQSASGSFWHAIMHRREGDFSNSKYWYARCADHPVLRTLGEKAGGVLGAPGAAQAAEVIQGGWNPRALVDLVASASRDRDGAAHQAAVALQRLEWRTLLEYCARRAAGEAEE